MITEAEIGVTQPQAKDCLEPPEAKVEENKFSPTALGGSIALLNFGPLASRTVRNNLSHSFKPGLW